MASKSNPFHRDSAEKNFGELPAIKPDTSGLLDVAATGLSSLSAVSTFPSKSFATDFGNDPQQAVDYFTTSLNSLVGSLNSVIVQINAMLSSQELLIAEINRLNAAMENL